jgi:hypothetical protein
MPRHLISDAHEWINEIPTVPIYYLAKPQPRERAWQNQRGKKTLSSAGASGYIGPPSTPCVRDVRYGGLLSEDNTMATYGRPNAR